jgi:hypothetical protein
MLNGLRKEGLASKDEERDYIEWWCGKEAEVDRRMLLYPLVTLVLASMSVHILSQRFSSQGKKHRIRLFCIHKEA